MKPNPSAAADAKHRAAYAIVQLHELAEKLIKEIKELEEMLT